MSLWCFFITAFTLTGWLAGWMAGGSHLLLKMRNEKRIKNLCFYQQQQTATLTNGDDDASKQHQR